MVMPAPSTKSPSEDKKSFPRKRAQFARPGSGKRGGGRTVYYAMIGAGRIYMMTAYPKNKQDDLTSEDRKAILRVIEQLLGGDQ